MPSIQDIAAITSAVANGAFVMALLYALRIVDTGKWVRGVDLQDCRKENMRLHRLLERRGVSAAELAGEAGDITVNGEHSG